MAGLSHLACQWLSRDLHQAAIFQSSNTLLPLQTVLSAVSWLVFSDTIMFYLLEARCCLERPGYKQWLHIPCFTEFSCGSWLEGRQQLDMSTLRLHRLCLGPLTTSPQVESKRVLSCLRFRKLGCVLHQVLNPKLMKERLS